MSRLSVFVLSFLIGTNVCALAAEPGQKLECAVVYGHGPVRSLTDPQVNESWNRVNGGFHQWFSEGLMRKGTTVHPLFLPVEATDEAQNNDEVLREAAESACLTVVGTSVFSDTSSGKPEVVFSVVLHSIEARKQPGGTSYAIGPERYSKQYRFLAASKEFSGLVLSDFGPRVAGELLAALGARQR
jgi:hypothetical protein